MSSFYSTYAKYKRYETPGLGKKQIARFDKEIWAPLAAHASMSFLEIGCGTGAFLAYLAAKGASRFQGFDLDPNLAEVVPENVRGHFSCRDVWEVIADPATPKVDRIIMLDVLEHFPAEDGMRLLQGLRGILAEKGRILVKVPNAASPWGLQYQNGDLTHCTAFSSLSLRQMAHASGYELTGIWGQRQGSRRRMVTDALVHRFLAWALLTPPEFFSANLYGMMEPR